MALTPQWNEPSELISSDSFSASWLNTNINENLLFLKTNNYSIIRGDEASTESTSIGWSEVEDTDLTLTHVASKDTALFVACVHILTAPNTVTRIRFKINSSNWSIPLDFGDWASYAIRMYSPVIAKEHIQSFAFPLTGLTAGNTYTFTVSGRTNSGTGTIYHSRHAYLGVIDL